MTGNGNHITYIYGDVWGMVNMTLLYPHLTHDFTPKVYGKVNVGSKVSKFPLPR